MVGMRWFVFCCMFVIVSACKKNSGNSSDLETVDMEATAEASKLIGDANDNLRRIRILYHNSRAKYKEFRKALDDRDSAKVRKLTDELSLIINDGYILAENAKDKDIRGPGKEYKSRVARISCAQGIFT